MAYDYNAAGAPPHNEFKDAQLGPGVQGRLHEYQAHWNNQANWGNATPNNVLPRSFVGDIFSKVEEQHSSILPLGQQVPVGIDETQVSVGNSFPEAGQVGTGTKLEDREGAKKPIAGLGYGKTDVFRPIKLAVIVTASEEYAKNDPEGMFRQLSTRLPAALGRAADLAVARGLDALRGTPLLGIEQNGYLTKTENAVELDFTRREPGNGDLTDQLLAGYDMVTADSVYDFQRFVAMPNLRPKFITYRTPDGSSLYTPGAFPNPGTGINVNQSLDSLIGIPIQYNKLVGGPIGNAAGDDTLMLAGDFSQFAYGWADQIRFKVTDSATLDDGNGGMISLWQTNQVAVLCEATFGWYVADPNAFVRYTAKAPEAGGGTG